MLMVGEIPDEVISFGLRVADYIAACCSKNIDKRHLLLPLVDHIYTTLERYKQGVARMGAYIREKSGALN